MVIQSYDVQSSSQRGYLSVNSASVLATRNFSSPVQGRLVTGTTANSNPNPNANQNAFTAGNVSNGTKGLPPGQLKKLQKQMQDDSIMYLSARSKGKAKAPRIQRTAPGGVGRHKNPSTPDELRKRLMDLMFELLTGGSRHSSSYSMTTENGPASMSMRSESESFNLAMSYFGSFFGIDGDPGAQASAGLRFESFRYETEQVSYQAKGIVNTADGRSINVDINMYMSREFVSYMNIDVETTRLYDPLVINYNGTAASLTGEKFSFDLTSDGNMESLASLGAGSGFLALDKNGDGIINDGSELFGPNSGCGFSELREYDKDGNGWIDEADDVFGNLVVWAKDKDGNETSYTLKELGIGAIFLGDIATEFSFKDEANQTLGVMRSTSFFLKEDGGAGLVSHIDLAV